MWVLWVFMHVEVETAWLFSRRIQEIEQLASDLLLHARLGFDPHHDGDLLARHVLPPRSASHISSRLTLSSRPGLKQSETFIAEKFRDEFHLTLAKFFHSAR